MNTSLKRLTMAVIVGFASLALASPVLATPSDKVTICHATNSHSNPYASPDVNTSSVDEANNKYLNGHGDHTGPVWYPGIADHSWGDIIPPFESPIGTSFPGQNWTDEGRAIWENGCKIPADDEPTVVTVNATLTEPTCDAKGFVTLSDGEGYEWRPDVVELHPGITGYVYTAYPNEGYVINGDRVFGPYVLAQLTGEQCDEGTTTTVPETTVPEVTDPTTPPVIPEVPETPVTPPALDVDPDTPPNLPSTGSENWIMAALAAALIAAGGGVTWLSRRPRNI